MEIDAFLADSVVLADGKVYAQGIGWNVLNSLQMPVRQNRIGIGLIIRVPYTATNQDHTFELRLEQEDGDKMTLGDDPSGGRIEAFGGQFQVGRPPGMVVGDEQIVPFALNIDGLVFEKAGRYIFVISLDGHETKRLPFRIVQIQQALPIIQKGG